MTVRLIGWFYIVYFALGMPFICWGAAAEPGHPHRLPHLVFAEPMNGEPGADIAASHHGHVHSPPATTTVAATVQPEVQHDDPQTGAGNATPAITLLALIFISLRLLPRAPHVHFPIELGALYARRLITPPLAPPPRLLPR